MTWKLSVQILSFPNADAVTYIYMSHVCFRVMGKLLQVSGERQFQQFLQNRKMLCRMPVSVNSETVNIIGKTNFADAYLAKPETQAAVLL